MISRYLCCILCCWYSLTVLPLQVVSYSHSKSVSYPFFALRPFKWVFGIALITGDIRPLHSLKRCSLSNRLECHEFPFTDSRLIVVIFRLFNTLNEGMYIQHTFFLVATILHIFLFRLYCVTLSYSLSLYSVQEGSLSNILSTVLILHRF